MPKNKKQMDIEHGEYVLPHDIYMWQLGDLMPQKHSFGSSSGIFGALPRDIFMLLLEKLLLGSDQIDLDWQRDASWAKSRKRKLLIRQPDKLARRAGRPAELIQSVWIVKFGMVSKWVAARVREFFARQFSQHEQFPKIVSAVKYRLQTTNFPMLYGQGIMERALPIEALRSLISFLAPGDKITIATLDVSEKLNGVSYLQIHNRSTRQFIINEIYRYIIRMISWVRGGGMHPPLVKYKLIKKKPFRNSTIVFFAMGGAPPVRFFI